MANQLREIGIIENNFFKRILFLVSVRDDTWKINRNFVVEKEKKGKNYRFYVF